MFLRCSATIFLVVLVRGLSYAGVDTSIVPDKINSFVEYNGLDYNCDYPITASPQYDSLIVQLKDSADKIQIARHSQDSWLQCSMNSSKKTIVVNIPSGRSCCI